MWLSVLRRSLLQMESIFWFQSLTPIQIYVVRQPSHASRRRPIGHMINFQRLVYSLPQIIQLLLCVKYLPLDAFKLSLSAKFVETLGIHV